MIDIEGIVEAANRAQQANDTVINNCYRTWHVGFFFDEVHSNIEKDDKEQQFSNISRLFRTYGLPVLVDVRTGGVMAFLNLLNKVDKAINKGCFRWDKWIGLH